MNELTVVGRGGVDHPYVTTQDQLQAVLDIYGTGGTAVTIPAGVVIGDYFARSTGGFFYDDPSVSQSTGSPNGLPTYYTVIYGGVPGNITLFANTQGNHLFIGEVYGDVFRGWKTFIQPDEMTAAIAAAITQHEQSVNHPYATQTQKGFMQIASTADAQGRTEDTHAMTSLKSQQQLDTYGISVRSLQIPQNTDLATYFNDKPFGVYHLDTFPGNGYANFPVDLAASWAEITCTSHEVLNYKSLTMVTSNGTYYTAVVSAGSWSGWRRKIEFADIPNASDGVRGLTRVVNSVTDTSSDAAASANAVAVTWADCQQRVPQGRRINGMTLTSDLTIDAHGVGAYTQGEINSLLANMGRVQDIRWSGETANANSQYSFWSRGRRTTVPAGAVISNMGDAYTDQIWIEDVDTVWYVYLQKLVGGVWYNVGL